VTKTRQFRDVAVDLRIHVTVEDTGGAEIDTANGTSVAGEAARAADCMD